MSKARWFDPQGAAKLRRGLSVRPMLGDTSYSGWYAVEGYSCRKSFLNAHSNRLGGYTDSYPEGFNFDDAEHGGPNNQGPVTLHDQGITINEPGLYQLYGEINTLSSFKTVWGFDFTVLREEGRAGVMGPLATATPPGSSAQLTTVMPLLAGDDVGLRAFMVDNPSVGDDTIADWLDPMVGYFVLGAWPLFTT